MPQTPAAYVPMHVPQIAPPSLLSKMWSSLSWYNKLRFGSAALALLISVPSYFYITHMRSRTIRPAMYERGEHGREALLRKRTDPREVERSSNATHVAWFSAN